MNTLLFLLLGTISWTLSEYILHRYIGHKKKGSHGFTKEHRAHHVDGNHFMPTLKKIVVSLKVIIPLTIISILLLDIQNGISFSVGFTFCFVLYEYLHKSAHTHPPRNAYGRWLRKHHFYHHFGAPHKNFGVTTPIWDIIFRSYATTDVILLPRKKAMNWLIDPQKNHIHEQFAQDYQLRAPQRKQSS